MRHGWIYVYESTPALARFEELVEHFALNGISLAEPGSGRVLRLSSVGEQIPSSREDIARELANSAEVYFNFYLAPSDNLFCSIVTLKNEIVREGYSLDGKTEEQSFRVIKELTQLFVQRAKKHTVSCIVADRVAELHRDFHWDDFVVGDAVLPAEWPLLLGFSKTFAKKCMVPDSLYHREEGTDYVLLQKD
jgi:hypothetical protein